LSGRDELCGCRAYIQLHGSRIHLEQIELAGEHSGGFAWPEELAHYGWPSRGDFVFRGGTKWELLLHEACAAPSTL
jgi:hypothetical protein